MLRTSRLISMFLLFTLVCGFSAIAFAQDDGPDLDIKSVSIGDLGASAPGQTSPTGTKRPPRVGPNIRANALQQASPNGLLGRSETTVASTSDGQSIIVGFNDAQGFCGAPFGVACTPQTPSGLSGFAFSTNGGLSFTDGGAPDPALFNNVFTRGDPWMDRGGFDNLTFYYANLAVDATTGADLGVSVHRGHFDGLGGFAFEDAQTFNAPNAPDDFYDKEAIATAKDGSGAGYVSVTNFRGLCTPLVAASGFGEITVWRTADGGNTWQGPVVAGPDLSDLTSCTTQFGPIFGVLQQSSVPAIGPNGEVYVAWQRGPTFSATGTSTNAEIVVARSLDGGSSFSTPISVAAINSMRQDSPVGYNRDRLNDHPRIAVARSGSHKGRIYVTFYSAVAPVSAASLSPCPAPNVGSTCRAQNLISSQVFVSFSDDKGLTWTPGGTVVPAPPATGVKRWWPVVNVEPGGTVDVVYYESQEVPTSTNAICNINLGGGLRRRGTANSLVNTFWAQSLDGGTTFQGAPSFPMQMSTATTNWCTSASNIRPNFGDYIGATFGGNKVLATWGDGRNGVPDTFYATGLGAGKSH